MANPKFYMQEISLPDNKPIKDLEADFPGLVYMYCKGLSAKGKVRTYTENYADANGARVYIPPIPTVDTTDIELSLLFKGNNRRDVFDSFYEYIKGKKLRFWDTVRNRRVEMYLSDKVDLSEDKLYGGTPYIQVSFKFINMNGLTTKV